MAPASLVPSASSERAISRMPAARSIAQDTIAQVHGNTPLYYLHDELVGIVMQLTGTTVSPDAPLVSAGLDSVSAAELST